MTATLQPVTISRISPLTGKHNTMVLNLDMSDYIDWQRGKLIQEAMPYLSADEREFLISGITPSEWEEMFG